MKDSLQIAIGVAAIAAAAAWLWADEPAAPSQPPAQVDAALPSAARAAVPHAAGEHGPSPFGSGPAVLAEAADEREMRERNQGIDVASLTAHRPLLAETLLHEVELRPDPHGGFTVRDVLPGSMSERLGLREGDLLLGIDTPANTAVDEQSMIALVLQKRIEVDVMRHGRPVHLALALEQEDHERTAAERR